MLEYHIDEKLQFNTIQAFENLYEVSIEDSEIQVESTRKDFEGDRTVIIFPLLRYSKEKPEDTGEKVGAYLKDQVPEIANYQVVKGFVNLTLTDEFWLNYLIVLADSGSVPVRKHERPQKVMVEYSSPNTNKPQHLGHIRNNILGYALAEIQKIRGHQVIKANLINDRGIHICKSMIAWMKFGEEITPESAGVKGDHLVGDYYVKYEEAYKQEVETLIHQGADPEEAKKEAPIYKEAQELLRKWEEGDEHVVKIWKMMNNWVYEGFGETYRKLGVDFDQYYYESETYQLGKNLINEGLEKGVFYQKSDGSVWVDLTDEGLDEKLVLRKDGTSVYITQDLGTAELKYNDYRIDQSIYVVGNEQDYHFKVLATILKKLDKPYADGIQHLSYGMVELPSGKMKSREGTVVDADDLMIEMEATARKYSEESGKLEGIPEKDLDGLYHQVGLGALKYFILKTEPKKNIVFEPDKSIDFQGDTGPFLQYTHARIRSVIRKGRQEYEIEKLEVKVDALNDLEKALIQMKYEFSNTVAEAERTSDPSSIAHYAFNLAKAFNKFYHECPILGEVPEAQKKFRLVLANETARHLIKAAELLGIELPERM